MVSRGDRLGSIVHKVVIFRSLASPRWRLPSDNIKLRLLRILAPTITTLPRWTILRSILVVFNEIISERILDIFKQICDITLDHLDLVVPRIFSEL